MEESKIQQIVELDRYRGELNTVLHELIKVKERTTKYSDIYVKIVGNSEIGIVDFKLSSKMAEKFINYLHDQLQLEWDNTQQIIDAL